ncbi:hypothetical protein [Pseudomonas sp. PSE1(2024)]|uniref:hypothetical protein n=1 Tax=Pseudomonas sp. PSE1(2024) TaxID=3228746 RepID=UPI003D9862F3
MENMSHLSLVEGREQWVVVRHLVGGVLIKTEVLEDLPAEFNNLELNGVTYRPAVIMGVDKGNFDRGRLIQPQADVHYAEVEAL